MHAAYLLVRDAFLFTDRRLIGQCGADREAVRQGVDVYEVQALLSHYVAR